jgi:phage-related minor tail protein
VATLADLLIKIGIDPKGVEQGGSQIESSLSKTWSKVGAAAAVGGAAVGAALMAGVQQVIESSKPAALLEAQLGAGTPLAAEAGKAAGDVYTRGFVGTMEEATDAVRAAVQNALVPPNASSTEIDKVASRIATLGGTMQEEAGAVSRSVSQMIRTGMVDSAQEGFDLLQRGVEMGVNKSEDLLDTFNEYGTQFRKLGLEGPEAMGMLSQAIQAGARDSDIAADALKEFSIRAIDGSEATAEAFKLLGLDAEKMAAQIAKGGPDAAAGLQTVTDKLRAMEDPVKREAAAVGLFGTQAEDLGDALLAIDPSKATQGLGNLAGSADRAGQALEQSAGAKLESFKRQAQAALVEQLAKAIPYIEATFGWLSRNSSWVVPLATALGILAAAIAIVVIAQKAWNAALLLSPTTWIVIAILAVVAALVYLATKTRFFQTIWESVWGFLKRVGAWFAGPFAQFFVNLGNRIKNTFASVKNDITAKINLIKAVFTVLKNHVVSMWNKVLDKGANVVTWFRNLPGRIRGALSNLFSPLWTSFRRGVNAIIGGWNRLSFTIGGGNFMGVSIPSVTVSTPDIPYLAKGGIVTRPTLAMVGEGGESEAVVPLSRLPELAGRGDRPIIVEIVPGGEPEFRKWIKKSIRVKGALG